MTPSFFAKTPVPHTPTLEEIWSKIAMWVPGATDGRILTTKRGWRACVPPWRPHELLQKVWDGHGRFE
jgi:hypothetical protein